VKGACAEVLNLLTDTPLSRQIPVVDFDCYCIYIDFKSGVDQKGCSAGY
jgi:hypothetical protein